MPINIKTEIELPTGKLSLEDYAAQVRRVELHLLDLKTEYDRIDELAAAHKLSFKEHAHGNNKEERETSLAKLLQVDSAWQQISDELKSLDWTIRKYKIEQGYYERMFRATEVKQEQINQAAALFHTFPADLT